jgi:hypothetical protein
MPILNRVPPLPFHPTPAVYSAQRPAGLLHPATGHEVRHVSGPSLDRSPRGPGRAWGRSRWRRPFEAFPSLVAVPCHHGLSLLAVGRPFPLAVRRCCHRVVAGFRDCPRPQGLEPPESPLRAYWRCRRQVARCFLGLLEPSQVDTPGCAGLRGAWCSHRLFGWPKGRPRLAARVLLLSSVHPRVGRAWRQLPLPLRWARGPAASGCGGSRCLFDLPEGGPRLAAGRRASGPPEGGPSRRRG